MHVLLLEDDIDLGQAITDHLEAAGHEVHWCKLVSQASDPGNADFAMLDLQLPDGDALPLLRHWRATGQRIPVLVTTARDQISDRIRGLEAGADDYLVKPITIDELAARLRAMVRRSAGRAQAVWQHGDLEYDPAAKIVRWKGQRVELTGFELALLETLLKHPQRVLSKANLQEKLYDWSGTEPESNAIEVHIHHLRRKIDPSIVRTVRGVGYSLGGETAPS